MVGATFYNLENRSMSNLFLNGPEVKHGSYKISICETKQDYVNS